MITINRSIQNADAHTNALGEYTASAEHYVLSALKLNDGSATSDFALLNIDAKNQSAFNKKAAQASSTSKHWIQWK